MLPTQLSGCQPEWFTTGFGLGYIGLAHTAQIKFDITGTTAGFVLYTACVVLGAITGKLVRSLTDRLTRSGAKADRIPRIFAAGIVLTGMGAGMIPGTTAMSAAPHEWTVQWLWLATGALLVVLTLIGEALVCWFPAAEPEPAPPVVTPVPTPRPRRRRLRPDSV
ncbi:hypothetical protein [Streptomyces sp. NPDC050704]|uniref:hypothetical protein n=1 Tax=Streptomyces sp. NPDC050704 TaxID=3157219 RepID=UPI0034378B36